MKLKRYKQMEKLVNDISHIKLDSMQEERKELEKIEHNKRTWKSDFAREQAIWEDIAMHINSYTGKKQAYWGRVMDLYKEKYR